MVKKKYFGLKFKRTARVSFVFLLSIFHFLFFSSPAQTAGLYFDTANKTVGVGQVFELKVLADSEGESANAIGGRVIIPNDYFDVQEIRDGNSLINFWVEKPRLVMGDGASQIFFSGIIPGGYIGKQAYLFSLVIKAKQGGKAAITTSDEEILLNDGMGTAAKINKHDLTLSISKEKTGADFSPLADTAPPEPFWPTADHDPSLFDDNWFLAFATQDKNSGLDYYEVCESKEKLTEKELAASDLPWVGATSPHQLSDQTLGSYIYVRAWDKDGNVRIAEVLPPKIVWYKNYLTYVKISLAAICVWLIIIIWRIKKRRKK